MWLLAETCSKDGGRHTSGALLPERAIELGLVERKKKSRVIRFEDKDFLK